MVKISDPRIVDPSSAAFFEAMYREQADPWGFATDPEELARYDAVMRALEGRRYRRAFEPGCSVGVLTERLAQVCDAVDAVDLSAAAVARARERCAHLRRVRVECESLEEVRLDAATDLLVLSEIGYYFAPERWRAIAGRLVAGLMPGATVLASHWLGSSRDHAMHGDTVHAILREDSRLQLRHSERHEGFRLERFERTER